MFDNDDPVEIPIDGTLDLHTFSPRDVQDLVPDYLEECLKRGITQVRIIHGKGTGTLRRIVRSILDRHPNVVNYWQDDVGGGSWGATVVTLSEKRQSK
jgi:dsDNA-specific endonuclease/ATPase MutS2